MDDLQEGQRFVDIPAEEFGRINKRANAQNLRAKVMFINEVNGERLISFYLVVRPTKN